MQPDVPAFLPPLPKNEPHDRLALGRWLVNWRNQRSRPRVIMNRFWQAYFGRGIVITAEDFGTQGDKTVASAVAGLAGVRIHGQGLGHESDAAVDC